VAYLYARFSSAKQAKGSSIRRQLRWAKDWCKRNEMTLDESKDWSDKGCSAFESRNAKTGGLPVSSKPAKETWSSLGQS
jgi:hypothetical protein